MALTFRQVQDEVLQVLTGFGLEQPRVSYLTIAVNATDLTFTLKNAANFDQGLAEIEDELVYVDAVDKSANTLTIAPDGRGWYGTTAASHGVNTRITCAPAWSRNRVKAAINDVITGVYPTLWGVAQTQFTFNPSVTTYSLPADAERVLKVTADVNGPSKEQQEIHRYSVNMVAPTDDWATTNTITFQEGVTPGKTVTVTYFKQPSELSTDSANFTTSGLRESAKLAIVYGACAQLASYVDLARLPVDTAEGDEFDSKVQVGTASRIAGQLRLYHENEVEKERKRLRAATPIPITIRKR